MESRLPIFLALAAIAFDCHVALSEEQPGVQQPAKLETQVKVEMGQRYTDGKHYAKFYVSVQSLEAVE